MLPVLFKIPEFDLFRYHFPGFEVRSYGVMLVIGVLLSVWWSRRRAPKWRIEPERIFDATLWGIIPGILGARIGYIVQEWDYYSKNTDEIWTLHFAGLTSFGGVLFAILGLLTYCKLAKVRPSVFLDVVAAPLLVAHAVGRIGCLLNGCCYGHQTTAWYGVPVDLVEGLFEPAQIYEAFLVMVGVGLILLFERKPRGSGSSFWLVVLVWGMARFIYEFFRAGTIEEVEKGIASSTYWGSLPITQAQAAALVMVVIGGVMLLIAMRRPPVEVKGAA